jgi:GH15 family glucan-1,4-alpha-glucosidase
VPDYNRIEDYGIIGDTLSTALINKGGSIDWLCWPRHDSGAVFLRLLDDEVGGFCDIVIEGGRATDRRYVDGTNILETTFATAVAEAVLTDFMPVRMSDPVPDEGPDLEARGALVRVLTCTKGSIRGRFRTKATFDYARQPSFWNDAGDRCASGSGSIDVWTDAEISLFGDISEAAFDLHAGDKVFYALGHGETNRLPFFTVDAGVVDILLGETRSYWEGWSRRCSYRGPYRSHVLRSALVLKLLTHSPSGAIIAAPTMGLPEAVPGDRNYDYRYAWLRDASFTVTSFVNLGYVREAGEHLRFLRTVDHSHGSALRLMYAIGGEVPDETELKHLKGWRGTSPVRIGNAAHDQRQFDIYGEYLIALHFWVSAQDGHAIPDSYDLPKLITNLAEAALAARDESDHGIWEMRTGRQHHVHTKGLLYLALDRAAKMARSMEGIALDAIERWDKAAQALKEEYLQRGWNREIGAYVQAYGSDVLDAAVMRAAILGAIDPKDPRMQQTVAAISEALGEDGDLIYRYRAPDRMQGQEATFLACAFWRVGCLALAGRTEEARAVYERLLSHGNELGLFAEELDAATGEHRGNFPQGFTHMAVINHALRLEGT